MSITITSLSNYKIGELIHESSRTLVYRGVTKVDSEPVIIKLLRSEFPSFSELVQFRNQYTIARNLQIEGIVKPLELLSYQNSYALIMPDLGGISLGKYYQNLLPNTKDISQFLDIAIQIAKIIYQLHQNRIIHKDIKPANILINPETKEVKIIDFSISTLLSKETKTIQAPNVLEGTLAYISPEQTGRMNRGIDYRSDFYSLGVTFFEMLNGVLPFQTTDPMELVHCHLAKMPILGSREGGTQIPQMLIDIVMKLMAKNAEDRYQTALGLKYDLEKCRQEWNQKGEIEYFGLGSRDISDRFLIPEKLYGRVAEVEQLLTAFERVAEGQTELMLVAGFSGIGKTAIVNEVHKPIVKQRGYFIKGKFDQFNRNIPFSALVQSLRDLMGQLLSEGDTQLQQWKDKILAAVGENGQVIIEVIPELEQIIGKQPTVPKLSGSAAQNRFNLLFSKFIQVFTTKEHPLVIFLDDLQWADSASLNLMKLLMNERERGYLLLIGAYRDNEVFPAHPLMLTLDDIAKQEGNINTITLAALFLEQINYLVADTLSCTLEIAETLTELVYQKTKGNPFFTTQFLLGLHGDRLIKFNWEVGHWECNISEIRQRALTDDVVEFMAERLQKLPEKTTEVLKLAACIGNQFDLQTLAIVCEELKEDTADSLWKALQEGFILPQSEIYKFYLGQKKPGDQEENSEVVNYKFLHDRVQQAAYSLIPQEQKQKTHYHIGKLLLQKIAPEAREEKIFELVNQLKHGTDLITEQKEKNELAELNLIACRKARNSTAYQAGREYANVGLSLLDKNAWNAQYKMSLEFHNLAAELASLSGDFEVMEQLMEVVIAQSHSILDQVHIHRIKVQAYASQNKLIQAVTVARKFLEKLGIAFPESPTEDDVQQALTEVRQLIGDCNLEDLVNLPQMTNTQQIAIVQIANGIMPAVYLSCPSLFPLMVCATIKLSIESGNTPASAYSYSCYGLIACKLLHDVDTGVKFGQLALQVVSKLNAKAIQPEVATAVGSCILHRKFHMRTMLPVMREGYETALEIGNVEFAGYTAHVFCLDSFWCNELLSTLQQQTSTYCNALVQFNQLTSANYCRLYWQSTLNLMGASDYATELSGEALQEAELLPQMLEANDLYGLYFFYLSKLMLCYLFAEIESAQNYAIAIKPYFEVGTGSVGEPAFYFYDSLTALASLELSSEKIEAPIKQVEQNQTIMQQHWASHAPMNYQHKVDLVEAEKYRVLGKNYEAGDFYDRAITGAKENEYVQEEALANELAAKFYLNWGKEKIAAIYMQEAYYCYARWGAKAKTDDLEKCYPNLLRPILEQIAQTLNPLQSLSNINQSSLSIYNSITNTNSSQTNINTTLDLAAILKTSQTLSRIIELDELLRQLTQIILQNSGGNRCALMLPDSTGEWYVKAIATLEETQLCSELLENNPNIPIKLIQYVKNTQEVVVVNDLKTHLPVIGKYLLQRKPKSVLCLPILNQGHLIGILYLKNLLTSGAFTKERILVLNFLCTQAAISLQNALLYQESQNYAQQLEQTQLQLVQSEKMASIGQLVSGVAHEINNPVGFIGGNLDYATEYIQNLMDLLQFYQQGIDWNSQTIQEKIKEIELDYLLTDLPELINSMKAGTERIAEISKSMRTFSRADTTAKVTFNIHDGIDSTLLILRHRLKANEFRPEIQIVKNYGNLPEIDCYPGQLNQVFMNLIANGIDALEESNSEKTFQEIKTAPNQITITTEINSEKQQAIIRIGDNGMGMSEEVKRNIFQHLFTTKVVGKGTGLGLSISRQIVEEKHGGKITCTSELGTGTEFVICLPYACN
ncbi:MAG: AAA family ATPase [Cyanobacteria bacterium P01_H01_bin.35]